MAVVENEREELREELKFVKSMSSDRIISLQRSYESEKQLKEYALEEVSTLIEKLSVAQAKIQVLLFEQTDLTKQINARDQHLTRYC